MAFLDRAVSALACGGITARRNAPIARAGGLVAVSGQPWETLRGD